MFMDTEGLQLSHFIKRESYTVDIECLKRTDTIKETDRSQSLQRKIYEKTADVVILQLELQPLP